MVLNKNLGSEENNLEDIKVGLLDFQDAVIGSPAYDLVSLLEDTRRDIDEENSLELFSYYLKLKEINKIL
jgi:aminoglycoside/choline kinase family phosphotransferase